MTRGIASRPKVRMDPCPASGRMGPEAVSWSCILERSHPSACLDSGLDVQVAAAVVDWAFVEG